MKQETESRESGQNPSYTPKVAARVNIKYTDGTEESFGFSTEENAKLFQIRSQKRKDVEEVKWLQG